MWCANCVHAEEEGPLGERTSSAEENRQTNKEKRKEKRGVLYEVGARSQGLTEAEVLTWRVATYCEQS